MVETVVLFLDTITRVICICVCVCVFCAFVLEKLGKSLSNLYFKCSVARNSQKTVKIILFQW